MWCLKNSEKVQYILNTLHCDTTTCMNNYELLPQLKTGNACLLKYITFKRNAGSLKHLPNCVHHNISKTIREA